MQFKFLQKGLLLLGLTLFLSVPLKVFSQSVQVTVDWNASPAGTIDQMIWGINDEQIRIPDNAADAGFNQFITVLNPELIRVHHAHLSTDWTNSTTRSWEVEKIKAGFQNATGYADAKIMFNIPRWPEWMGPTNEPLAKEYEEEFIELVAELVVIMRDEVRREVAYWEIINEREGVYEKAGKLDDLWHLVNRIADRIREIDSNTKVGGPALTWANPDWTESFLNICGPKLDFITWHNYASGSPETTNDKLFFNLLNQIDANSKYIKSALKSRGLEKMETFLTEYNVQWTWTPFEIRHANNVGAVFQACFLKRAALTGVTGVNVWHLKGNAYGLIDSKNVQRATGSLYLWGNRYLYGTIANSTVADSTLEVLPVIMPDGKRSLLLMNKTAQTMTVPDGGNLLTPGSDESLRSFQINDSGYLPQTIQVSPGDLSLPPYSVTLITTAMEDTQAPYAPTNLQASDVTDNSVNLSWTASEDNVGIAGYDLYNGTTKINTSLITTPNYMAKWLNASTSYNFTLKAIDNTGLVSSASAALSVTTLPKENRQGSAILTPTSLENTFGGNMVNDDVQTTTASGRVDIKQDEVLRLEAVNLEQYQNVYVTTLETPINLSANSTFSVDIKSNVSTILRIKLFDDEGNTLDNRENTLYLTGDNMTRTYNLDFAAAGLGSLNPRVVKGIKMMHLSSGSLDAILYMDNLRLGVENYDLEPPTAPRGLVASDITGHSATLSWDAAADNEGVDGYDVYIGDSKLNSSALTNTSYTATWLEPNTTYSFTVRALDVAGNQSEASELLEVTTGDFEPSPGSSVRTPTMFIHEYRGNVVNDTVQNTTAAGIVNFRQNEELRLEVASIKQWQNVYKVTFKDPIDLSQSADLSIKIKSNLSVRLRAKVFDVNGKSIDYWGNDMTIAGDDVYRTFTKDIFKGGSGSVDRKKVKGILLMYSWPTPNPAANATIFIDDLILGKPDTQAPTKPDDLQAEVISGSKVDLSWTASKDSIGVFRYNVYNGNDLAGTTSGTAFSAEGLTPAQTYTFTVKAQDETGNESAGSNAVTVTTPDDVPPSAPEDLTASAITPYALTLSWQASIDNIAVTGYDVYQDGIKLNTEAFTGTQMEITSLTADVEYSFMVKALDAAGNESDASILSASTPPPASHTYEAEEAALAGAQVISAFKDYSGSGYVNLSANKGNYVEWSVNGIFNGSYSLSFRYTRPDDDNKGEDASLGLSINGTVVQKRLLFPATASSSSWQSVELHALLQEGPNTIRLYTIGGATPQLDYLKVTDPLTAPEGYSHALTTKVGATTSSRLATDEAFEHELKLYPNPARDQLSISLWSEAFGEASIVLNDMTGRTISVSEHQLQHGTNTVEISVGELQAGSYLLTIQTADGRITNKKLLVSR